MPKQGETFSESEAPSIATPPAEQDPAPRDTPTPQPTGPGEFACAPDGTCNRYGEDARKQYCSVTYADTLYLDSCSDTTKQCNK